MINVWVSQFFGGLNFAIIVFGIYYLFQRFRPKIESALQQEDAQQLQQQNTLIQLQNHYDNNILAIQTQEAISQQLMTKIEQWRQAYLQTAEQAQRDAQERWHKAEQRNSLQQKNLEASLIFKQALPQALDQIEEEARQIFLSPEEQKLYVQKIINAFAKQAL